MKLDTGLDDALARVAAAPANVADACELFAVGYIGSLPEGASFTMGEVRGQAQLAGINPAEPRVWGAVTRKLVKRLRLIADGHTTNGRTHGGVATRWRKPPVTKWPAYRRP